LRGELAVTMRQKQETEEQKRYYLTVNSRVFVREKMDLIREKSELSAADQDMIIELQFRVSSLTEETGLLQRDKKALTDALKVRVSDNNKKCKSSLDKASKLADTEHEAALQSEYWKSQSEEQAMMIQTLQEELEYERSRSEDFEAGRDVEERRASLLESTRDAEGPWEWRKWMDRSWV
jgi:seryl-tRNA synthetase